MQSKSALRQGDWMGDLDGAKILILWIEKLHLQEYRSLLTAERRSIYNSGHHVNAESLRDVHVLLLLLCMRVLWRREAAEVKGFF